MGRSNEIKLAGVQVVGYGHPTIFVIENVNEGTVAVMHSGLPWQARQSEAMSHCLSSILDTYLRTGLIRWAKGRPVHEGDELVMPKPVVHPSQEAFAKAAGQGFSITAGVHTVCFGAAPAKTPDVSAGFGQAVIDQALAQQTCPTQAKFDKLDERVKELTLNLAEVEATLVLTQRRLGELNYAFLCVTTDTKM